MKQNRKTIKKALLLIPGSTNDSINRHAYLSACVTAAEQLGYIVVAPAVYETYSSVDPQKYLPGWLFWADSLLLFNDFGFDDQMLKSAEWFVERGKGEGVHYLRIQKPEIDKIFIEPMQILKDVSRRTGIRLEDLQGKSRRRDFVDARFIYYRRAREINPFLSYSQIGLPVGRDHATVIHGIRQAYECPTVKDKYNSYYGKAESKKPAVGQGDTGEADGEPGEGSVLSHIQVDKKEQLFQAKKPSLCGVPAQWAHQGG